MAHLNPNLKWTLVITIGMALSACASKPQRNLASSNPGITETPYAFALGKIQQAQIPNAFAQQILKRYKPADRDQIVDLNVLGFLRKADFSHHYSPDAVKRCQVFLKQHKNSMAAAEKRYNVPKEVIVALLWVETKLGKLLGSQQVGHVYFHLLQADHPEVMQNTLNTANRMPASALREPDKIADLVEQRSKTKAAWALVELQALYELQKQGVKNPGAVRGSFAGAFGISQFIPSSYLAWTKDRPFGNKKLNLFSHRDAIYSVAHYLHDKGWKEGDVASHKDALFKYNRSMDYVDVILKIANAI